MPTPLSDFALAVAALVRSPGATAYTYETIGKGPADMPIAALTGTAQPSIYTDCSGWVNYALNSVAPIHQAVAAAERNDPRFNPGVVNAYGGPVTIQESLQPWARADVLSYFFGTVANGSNGFVNVGNFGSLQAGDIIAYATGIYSDPRNPNASQMPSLAATSDTGHTMIVAGAPVAVPTANWGTFSTNGLSAAVAQVYAVPVVDSSTVPHFIDVAPPLAPAAFAEPLPDLRSYQPITAALPNVPAGLQSSLQPGGLGTGTLWFATDADGNALQFRFNWGDPWFSNTAGIGGSGADDAVSISAGRLTSTIDLSGSMLDADNHLVVTAFADAAPVLGNVAYNTQAETITGAGGLWVVGGGKVTLGAGNSFSGGLFLNGATVELAGQGAAGTGAITFVSGAISKLLIDTAAAVPTSQILNFSAGATIDLAFHAYAAGDQLVWTQADASGGTLSLVSQGTSVVSLALAGMHSLSEFSLGSDGHGGTLIAEPAIGNTTNNTITQLFVGYFNRAPDPVGETYWADQLQRGVTPVAIAQSFSTSNEATGLYPFLANPGTASPAAIESFVSAVYGNMFGRSADAAGAAYWVTALQTGASTVGAAIVNIASGAQGSDAATLANKVTVGNYYDVQVWQHDAFTLASAQSAIASVTSSAASVTAAMNAINAYVGGATVDEVAVVGLS